MTHFGRHTSLLLHTLLRDILKTSLMCKERVCRASLYFSSGLNSEHYLQLTKSIRKCLQAFDQKNFALHQPSKDFSQSAPVCFFKASQLGLSISRVFESIETTKPILLFPGIPGSSSKPEKSMSFLLKSENECNFWTIWRIWTIFVSNYPFLRVLSWFEVFLRSKY